MYFLGSPNDSVTSTVNKTISSRYFIALKLYDKGGLFS